MNRHNIRVHTREQEHIIWSKPLTVLMPQRNAIHCWKASVDEFPGKQLWDLLSEKEKERAGKFIFEKAREIFVLAHGLLRFLISKYIDIPAKQIAFSYGKNGKPFLSQKDICFNISHSKKDIILVFSRYTVGCDIEEINAGKDVRLIIKGFFNLEEQLKLASSASDYRQFLKLWTGKEAFLKATGIGILTELKQINLAAPSNFIEINPSDREFFESEDYYILTGFTDNNNILSIASTIPLENVHFYDLSQNIMNIK